MTRNGHSVTRNGHSVTRNGHSVTRNAHSVSRNGNFKQLNSHFIIVYIIFPGFYPLNSIVLDKNRLFYPVQRVYWIKSCMFAIINE